MAAPHYEHPHGDVAYAPTGHDHDHEHDPDPPIDPILQLHRSYDEHQHQQQLAALPVEHPHEHRHELQHQLQHQHPEHEHLPDHHPQPDFGQGDYPPPPVLDGPSLPATGREGFRPHQDPRPIIPPGIDTSRVDLTYRRNPRSQSANNPGPDGWLYPHKKGIGTGSNLEAFKDEIEARTMRGENCKTISAALNAVGVQTSDKAISRVRIKWGMRKRSQRKIKTPPPDSDAARLTAKTKVQTLRKIEIQRMTEEGMTADQIYENLTSRGMELKKGVATVLRLQSAWKLTVNPKRWLENFRHQCHKKAKAQQVQAFKDIAKEMVLDDFDAWLEAKLAEQPVREARHELAIRMMGEHAPTVNRRKLQARRGERRASKDAVDGEDEDEDGDEDEGWQEAMPNVNHEDVENEHEQENQNEHAGLFNGLNGQTSAVFVPMDANPEVGMMDVDDGPDSATNVAMRAFESASAVVNQTSPAPAAASTPVPPKSRPSKARNPSASVAAPGSKRGKGRPNKPKQAKSGAKQGQVPTQDAPIAQMTPDESGSLAHDEASVAPGQRGAQASPATTGPALVLRPEEAEANRSTLSTLDQYKAAAEVYQQVLQARTDNKPMLGSLTGLPPSSKEVEAAKRRLKEVTQAMMLNLD